MTSPAYLGIDIGTTGVRACIIDDEKNQLVNHHIPLDSSTPKNGKNEQQPLLWQQTLEDLLEIVSKKLSCDHSHFEITAVAIDGTSSTLMACMKDGTAISPALMYNDQQSIEQAQYIKNNAPLESAVHGASSSLAKALNLLQRYPETEILCHQADWLASFLTGKYGISDENNCLKLGYDSVEQRWPDWLKSLLPAVVLPTVLAPGEKLGSVRSELVKKYKLAKSCMVIAGTTDSNAAVLATGAKEIGDAVTSLGSTLVIKLFTDKPLFNAEFGVYSHRLNSQWLVGGASNSGGAVLLQYFSQQQLEAMTPQLTPELNTGLQYYPLPGTGERFPVNDSKKKNITTPRPESDIKFFQGLLEGIANIEADGYKKLTEMGATRPRTIFTAGGGSKNLAWNKIREKAIGANVLTTTMNEASYGSALLARQGFNTYLKNTQTNN